MTDEDLELSEINAEMIQIGTMRFMQDMDGFLQILAGLLILMERIGIKALFSQRNLMRISFPRPKKTI